MSHQIFFGLSMQPVLHQQFAVIFVLGKRFKGIRNSGARKTLEHFEPVTFQTGVASDPKRRVHRERIDVRQKIARLIHHVNGRIAIRNADVNVQSENQIRTREQLHVLARSPDNVRPR